MSALPIAANADHTDADLNRAGPAHAATAATSEFRAGWPAVLACFAMAIFVWGFGFYGQPVYLAELQRANGWSTALVSASITFYYVFGAACLLWVSVLFSRVDLRILLCGGVCVMALGAIGVANARHPVTLFASSAVLGVGWAATSSTAISTTLARWFDRKRGLAISLALNGASLAGVFVAPLLVRLSAVYGLAASVTGLSLAMLALLLPLLMFGLASRAPVPDAEPHAVVSGSDRAPDGPANWRDAMRSLHFWSIAAPFALGFGAQVGFLMHQVALLLPALGSEQTAVALMAGSFAAFAGRVALGFIIDRVNQRLTTALSIGSQALALVAIIIWPRSPQVLFPAVILFGLSVGNLITLPATIIQHEFPARAFSLIMGMTVATGQFFYAFFPAVVGVVHDLTGGYGAPLALCVALQIIAAVLLLRPPRRDNVGSPM